MKADIDSTITTVRPITIAVLALGGEGGGVLADWIVDVAEHGGYLAQATSVPGVAQRTGATVYYLELFPKNAAQAAGRAPVLALMPMPGDVDVVLASELMEAARALERGFVTPDRTLLIASTHRVYAMTEKIALADGRADAAALYAGCRDAARQLVTFDMAALADATGSVVSAVLFGALAGSGALPFARMAFEAAIRRGGVGVTGSLAAFSAGYEAARSGEVKREGGGWVEAREAGGNPSSAAPKAMGFAEPVIGRRFAPTRWLNPSYEALREVAQKFSGETRAIVLAGIERLNDYQDADYAKDYLARLECFREIERAHGDGSERVLAETARQLALAMAYEDTVRVADLKIRAGRFARVREEAQVGQGEILEIAEFFHPRTEEIADTLPAPLGRWLLRARWARALSDRLTRKGRIVKTTSVSGFLLLYLLAKLKPLRRRSLRFAREQATLASWLDLVANTAPADYPLALVVARMRGLVKGYGDTHARGVAKYEKLAALVPQLTGRADSATRLEALLKAANADESGATLEKALAEMKTAA